MRNVGFGMSGNPMAVLDREMVEPKSGMSTEYDD
jgi:hypothetical protein